MTRGSTNKQRKGYQTAIRCIHFLDTLSPPLRGPILHTGGEIEIFAEPCTSVNMKVTIEEWHAVASWRWDMPEDDVCGICRVQFDGTCPTCKYPGDDCTLCVSSSVSYHPCSLLTFSPHSNRQMWSLFPYGTSLAFSIANAGTLIVFSIASSLGYNRTLRRGCVLCVDKVCFLAPEGSK